MLRTAFIDKSGAVRSGWRVVIFAIVASVLWTILAVPFGLLQFLTDTVMRLAGLAAVLGASYLMLRIFHRKPLAAIGLYVRRSAVREFWLGGFIAVLMQSLVFLVQWSAGWVSLDWRDLPSQGFLLVLVLGGLYFLLVAAFEEVVFRGSAFQSLVQGMSFVPATLVMAVLFSLAHASNPNASAFGLINVGLAALWLSVAYFKTRGLWLPIGLHFGWNFAQSTLFGLPTSGVIFNDESLVSTVHAGPMWLTGGDFGPEGGFLATIALVSCTLYILRSERVKAQEGIVTLDSSDERGPEGIVPAMDVAQREGA